jgi:hypothetical protein
MTKTFTALKIETASASSPVEMYRAVREANEKLQNNIAKAQLLSYTHGRAAEAHSYFETIIPGWQKTVNEINAIWTAAVTGKPAEEIVAIICEATGQKLAA